jgi:hypothetical protein
VLPVKGKRGSDFAAQDDGCPQSQAQAFLIQQLKVQDTID